MGENGAEITSLYIDVETNAEEAERQLAKLKDTIKSMKGSGKGADVTFSKVSQEAKKATANTKGLLSQIARIGKMMLIRSALRGVVKAAKEGYQNLLLYSKAVNSSDSANAANTANEYAKALLQCKNAAGAAFAPFSELLLPVVQTITGWFIAAANAVNQFISVLMGKDSYTKALGVAVDYVGGLEKGAGGANSAMKELKKTILGFDEINALDDASKAGGSGGGGGGGGGGASVGDMFTDAPLEGWGADAANYLMGIWETFGETIDNVGNSIQRTRDNYEVCMAIIEDNYRILKDQKDMWAEYFKTIGQYEKAKKLGDIIFDLSEKASKGTLLTRSEMNLLRDSISELNGMNLDGIYIEIDELGRVTNMTREEFESLIETQLNLYKVQAAQEMLVDTYKRQYEATQNMRVAWDAYEEATKRAKEAQERWNVVSIGSDNQFHSMKEQWEAWAEKNAAEQALRDCEAAVQDSIDTVNDLNYDVELLQGIVKEAARETNLFGSSGVDSYKKIQDAAMDTAGAYKYFKDEAKKHLDDYKRENGIASNNASLTASSISKAMNGIGSNVDGVSGKVKTLSDRLKNLSDVNVSVHYSSSGAAHGGTSGKFASGGYPDRGDVFVANEAGPELVGTINGRPAVASNNEITGITAAVNESSAREALLLNALINVANSILSKDNGGGGITTEQLVAAMNRQNRRDGTSTFAVAT